VRGVNHLTGNDTIGIERRIYWYAGEGSGNRMDRWLGIADASVSVGARELCCTVAADCSFAKAARKLKQVGQRTLPSANPSDRSNEYVGCAGGL
jgi:hypothetical protein